MSTTPSNQISLFLGDFKTQIHANDKIKKIDLERKENGVTTDTLLTIYFQETTQWWNSYRPFENEEDALRSALQKIEPPSCEFVDTEPLIPSNRPFEYAEVEPIPSSQTTHWSNAPPIQLNIVPVKSEPSSEPVPAPIVIEKEQKNDLVLDDPKPEPESIEEEEEKKSVEEEKESVEEEKEPEEEEEETAEEEEEIAEEEPEPEEEEEEYQEFVYKNKTYYTNDLENGELFELNEEGDLVGEAVGKITNGKGKLFNEPVEPKKKIGKVVPKK